MDEVKRADEEWKDGEDDDADCESESLSKIDATRGNGDKKVGIGNCLEDGFNLFWADVIGVGCGVIDWEAGSVVVAKSIAV